jgi:hypothetical protein
MVTSLIPPRLTGRDKLLSEGMFRLKEKPGPGMCCVHGCRDKVKPRYPGLGLCQKHYMQRWRQQSPRQAAYHTLKMHAKQRGLEFNISFDYFRCLMDLAGHLHPSPDGFKNQPSVDRVDAAKGYVEGNLTIVSVSENAAKSHREKYLPAHVQAMIARKREQAFKVSGATESSWLEDDRPF